VRRRPSESAREWAKLEARSRALESDNLVLGLTGRILAELMQLLLEGQGLASLVERLGLLVGNPVSVSDHLRQILASSPVGPSADPAWRKGASQLRSYRALLRDPTIGDLLRRQSEDRQSVVLPVVPGVGMEQRRIVVPILVGDDIIGYLTMLETEQPIKEFHAAVLQQGSLVLALELQKQRAALETELRLTSDFLRDLFGGDYADRGDIISRASFLGMDLLQPWFLLMLDVDDIDGLCAALKVDSPTYARRELLEILRKLLQVHSPEGMVVVHGESIVVFTPAPSDADSPGNDPGSLAEALRQELRDAQLGTTVSVALGGLCSSLEDFPSQYAAARRAMDIARSLGGEDQTLSLECLGIYSLLFRAEEPGELLRFADRLLDPIVTYDRERKTKLMTTLDTYLGESGAFRKTARKLFIHLNTLRGRLERIEQTCNLDLRDARTRFNLQLALEVYRVARGVSSGSAEQPSADEDTSD
jgi:sugar diacid utilization regulator